MVTAGFQGRVRGPMLPAVLGTMLLLVGTVLAADPPPPVPGVPRPQPPTEDQQMQDYGNINYAPLWIPHQPITSGADIMMAEACLRVGTGEAYLLCGIGRNYHAVARSRELDNALKEVDTYFKRQILNAYYRAELKALPEKLARKRVLDRMEGLKEFKNKRIEDYYEWETDSRQVESLNWLLTEVFRQRLQRFGTTGTEPPALSPDQVKDIWVTRSPVRGLAWHINAPAITNEQWPPLLQDPRLKTEVEAFDKVYAAARAAVNARGKLDKATSDQLQAARDALEQRFEEIHVEAIRTTGESSAQDFANARGYLGHLRNEVGRLLNAAPGKGGEIPGFEGRDMGYLVDYMGLNGLYFAKSAPDGAGTYQFLFFNLRSMAGANPAPPAK